MPFASSNGVSVISEGRLREYLQLPVSVTVAPGRDPMVGWMKAILQACRKYKNRA